MDDCETAPKLFYIGSISNSRWLLLCLEDVDCFNANPIRLPMCWGVLIGSIPWIKEGVEMLSDGLVLKYHKDYDYGDAYEL